MRPRQLPRNFSSAVEKTAAQRERFHWVLVLASVRLANLLADNMEWNVGSRPSRFTTSFGEIFTRVAYDTRNSVHDQGC